jgi:5-methyltetrahydrofolate--homocysteine methyltransferase
MAERAVRVASAAGLPPHRLFLDPLVLTAAAAPGGPRTTWETVSALKGLGVRTICGASNVSHGLPARGALNRPFLAALAAAGLDSAITDPLDGGIRETLAAAEVLFGRDEGCARWIGLAREGRVGVEPGVSGGNVPLPEGVSGGVLVPDGAAGLSGASPPVSEGGSVRNSPHPSFGALLAGAVLDGDARTAGEAARGLLAGGTAAETLFAEVVVPSLDRVGELYDCGEYFLPQLVASAEAAQAVSREVEAHLPEGSGSPRGIVVLATVEGDLHDLGKKLVGMMLKTRGYRVVDLGKNVPAGMILDAAFEHDADVVGLSALMTSTAPAMGDVIRLARERGLPAKIIVGGAVVTPEFARSIGADGTSPDAVAAVRLVDGLLGKS